MNTAEWIAIAAAVIALVVAAYAYYRSGKQVTLEGVQEAYTQSQSLAAELNQVATVAVAAAQQLKESKKITNDEAFQAAVEHVETWFDQVVEVELDPVLVANAIEGAYYALTKLQATRTGASDSDYLDKWLSEESKP